jgi:hypothetical protein
MNDRFFIYFVVSVVLYILLLFFVVLPLMRTVSERVQGVAFTYRLQGNQPTKTPPEYAKYDILWSAAATFLTFLLAVIPAGIFEESGLADRLFGH